MTSVVRSNRPDYDDIESLRAKLAELDRIVVQRAGDVARTRADLETFRIRYRREVGSLHEELEELEQAIAEIELGQIATLLDGRDKMDAPPHPSQRARRDSHPTPSGNCFATSRRPSTPTSPPTTPPRAIAATR